MKDNKRNKIFLSELIHINDLNQKNIGFHKSLYPGNSSGIIQKYFSIQAYGLNLNKLGLTDFQFYKCNFSNCSFNNTFMNGINFINCDFTNSDFSNSRISFSNFENCKLENSNFYNCDSRMNEFSIKNKRYLVGNLRDSFIRVILYTQFGISLKTWGN